MNFRQGDFPIAEFAHNPLEFVGSRIRPYIRINILLRLLSCLRNHLCHMEIVACE